MTRSGTRSATSGASSGAGSNNTNNADTVRQTIVETLEAPRLENITTEAFVTFKQKRALYERRIEEKNKETGGNVPVTTYCMSISKPVLDMLVTAQWVPADHATAVTEEPLMQCVEERSCVAVEDYDLAQIQRDIQHVKMPTSRSLEMCVWKLGLAYATALENRGYSRFIDTRQEIAVEHIMSRVTHPQLRKRLTLTIKLKKPDGFKNNYGAFMRELAREAREIDRQEEVTEVAARRRRYSRRRGKDSRNGSGSHNSGGDGGRGDGRGSDGRNGGNSARSMGDGGERGKGSRKNDKPTCLNPKCNERHFMNECTNTAPDEKKRLLDAYHKSKKSKANLNKDDGKVTRLGAKDADDDSSLFSATFCEGALKAIVLADSGSDANIIPPAILKQMLKADKKLDVQQLPTTVHYGMADATAPSLPCSRKVTATVQVRVRHGTNLAMRGVEWLVSDRDTEYVFIGKRVLAAIGRDNRSLLAATCDRHGGVLNIPDLLKKRDEALAAAEQHAGAIHSILQLRGAAEGSTFHSHGGVEEDNLEDSDVYVDLGEDPIEDLEAALAARVADAKSNGLSDAGAARLATLLSKYKQIFEFGWDNPHQPTLSQ